MTKPARLSMIVATLLLATLYFLPLWHISLSAPQYPEGLGMQIRINTIVGDKEHDLENINGLNHYIGMRPIVPDEIPEFRIMPWALGVLVGLGVLTVIIGRRGMVIGWLAGVAAFGILGMVDFYRWGYNYGHNLDPKTAIIKIPGMSYQPPLIGAKQILNFVAESWPALGTWMAMAAVMFAVIALYLSRPRARPAADTDRPAPRNRATSPEEALVG